MVLRQASAAATQDCFEEESMKTKIFALFTLLTLCLGACSAGAAPAMYIQPAELNEEEEAVAKLLGADTSQHLYDIVLDGTARKISVRVYELIGGEWESFSGGGGTTLEENDKKGRIAFGFEDLRKDFRQAVQFGKDCSAVSWNAPEEETGEPDGMATTTSYLSNRTEIVYEKEVPIAVQIVTSKNEISSYDPEYFFQPEEYEKFGYEHVYALTVLFSQEPLS